MGEIIESGHASCAKEAGLDFLVGHHPEDMELLEIDIPQGELEELMQKAEHEFPTFDDEEEEEEPDMNEEIELGLNTQIITTETS